jgi:F-type H+-transporting ATPase subunit a
VRRALFLLGLLALALPPAALAKGDFHPEEEFELHRWGPKLAIGPIDLSLNKAVAYLLLGALVTILLGLFLMRFRLGVRPGTRQTIGEQIYEVAQTQIAEQGLPSKAIGRWFPYVATLLLFIWVLNVLGFIPLPLSDDKFHLFGLELPTFGIYAATASLSVTLTLSILTFVFSHYEGFRFNGWTYPKLLIPDVPKGMLPFIVPIEIISVFMRLISLSVRLFANMLAGHMLILVMIGLIFVLENVALAVIGVPVAIAFYLFEVVIVVTIQAFIFAALSAIYIGTAIEPAH